MIYTIQISCGRLVIPLAIRRILNRYGGEYIKIELQNGVYYLSAGDCGDLRLNEQNEILEHPFTGRAYDRIEAVYDYDQNAFLLAPPTPRCRECQKTNTRLININGTDYCDKCFRALCTFGCTGFPQTGLADICKEYGYSPQLMKALEKQKERSRRFRNELQGFEIVKYLISEAGTDAATIQLLDVILDNLMLHCANYFYKLGKDNKS